MFTILHINEVELQILSSTLMIKFRTHFSAFQLALTIHSTQTSQMTLPFCTYEIRYKITEKSKALMECVFVLSECLGMNLEG